MSGRTISAGFLVVAGEACYFSVASNEKMNLPDPIELKNIDPDDISNVLLKVEKSFGFKFGHRELNDIKSFGQLCDLIVNKVQGEYANDCTSQQGFYKLRYATAKTQNIDISSITPDTYLHQLFPRPNRRQKLALLEKELGFKLHLLRPQDWITNSFVLILLASIVFLFIFWQAGLMGIIFSITGLKISERTGKELILKTFGELAANVSRENYFSVRRSPSTGNKSEVAKMVTELFSESLALDKSLLTREATFD